jgi:microcystin-dependent protein
LSVTFVDGTTPLNAANLNTLESKPAKGQPNGYAALDGTGKVPAAQLPAASAVPTGAGFDFYGSVAPAGFLLCDGSAVSRATYAALFGVIGTQYGVGDGSTTFNLPDCQGRATVGKGTHADVNALGLNEGSAVNNRRPRHPHTNGLALTGAPGLGTLALPNHAHGPGSLAAQGSGRANYGNDPGTLGGGAIGSSENVPNFQAALVGASGNPTALPAITGAPAVGTLAVGGTIGVGGTAADSAAYLVANRIIKT